jgi:hypothetical protein
MTKLLMLLWLVLSLVSCVYSSEKNTTETVTSITCKDPRPQVCTREYNPVCATLKDGSSQTMATACTACSSLQVTAYEMGECK